MRLRTARRAIAVLGLALTLALGSGLAGCVAPNVGANNCLMGVEADDFTLTNQARSSMGVAALTCDVDLARTAELHSQDMCDKLYFSHTGLDGSTPGTRLTAQGVTYTTWGENIAQGPSTADSVHTLWMNSSGHRANILNPNFGRIGIGYVACNGTNLWTQVFTN